MTKLYQLQEQEREARAAQYSATRSTAGRPSHSWLSLERFRNAPQIPLAAPAADLASASPHYRYGCRMMRLPQPSTASTSPATPTLKESCLHQAHDDEGEIMGTTLGTFQLPMPLLPSSSACRQCLLWSAPSRRGETSAIPTAESEEFKHAAPIQFAFPFAFSVRAQSTHAQRTHALPPEILVFQMWTPPRGKLWSPSTNLFHSPWEWAATAHPPGKHVPHPATNFKKGATNHVQQVILIGRLGKKQKSKPRRTRRNTPSSASPPARAGRTTRRVRNPHRRHASTPGQSLQLRQDASERAARQLGGKIKYRTVEEDVEASRSSTPSPRSTLPA